MEKKQVPLVIHSTKIQPENVNIDGSTDSFYRYKMRQLFVQVIGKGKMIKTALLNVDDVAKDIKVSPAYMTAYMGYELGAQSKYNPKKSDRERASLSGEHQAQDLADVFKKFIRDFVLCPRCKLPETVLETEPDLQLACGACGTKSSLIALKQKFLQFIKHHPENIPPPTKQEKTVQNKQKQINAAVDETKAAGKTTTKAKKAKKEEEEIEWSCDVSSDAVRKRRLALLPDSASSLVQEDKKDPLIELNRFIEEHIKTKGGSADVNTSSINTTFTTNEDLSLLKSEINRLKEFYGLSGRSVTGLLLDAIFPSPLKVAPDFGKNLKLIKLVLNDEKSRMGVLEWMEERINSGNDTILEKKAIASAKLLYDQDLLTEDVFLKWDSQLPNCPTKTLFSPFIKWLKEAEEEEE